MSDITIIVTDAGRAALVNADNTGTAPVTVAACGLSATALVPTPAATALPDEIKRIATLSGDVVDDDTIHLIVSDEGADAYTLRSLALYLGDGTLFAIYGQEEPIIAKVASSSMMLAIDVRFADIAAAALTFGDTNFLNPPATTTVQGVVELATEAESATGTDAARAVTPKGLKAAVTGWLDARFGEGTPSAWIKSILGAANAAALRLALALDKVNNTPDADKPVSTPQQAALYAKADKARTIVAGNGLIGGGTLEANRTVGMGTPGTIGPGSQNAVTATSHTHALSLAKVDIGLGNVDNTADAAKPVSMPQQEALNGKVTKSGDTMTGYLKIAYSAAYAGMGVQNNYGSSDRDANVMDEAFNENGIIVGSQAMVIRADGSSEYRVALSSAGSRTADRRQDVLVITDSGATLHGFAIWNAGNLTNLDQLANGPGYTRLADFAGSDSPTGYCRLPGGRVLQWGSVYLSEDSYATITFPLAMAYCGYAAVEGMGQVGNDGAANNNPRIYGWSGSSANIYNPQAALNARWFAIGYL